MSNNWPPDPNQIPPQNTQPPPPKTKPQLVEKEWLLLEKTLMASIEEQRRARRWGIFFKLLTFGYIILIAMIMGKGCSSTPVALQNADKSQPHLAVVDVKGVISADQEANSRNINTALTEAFENKNAKAVALRINSPGGSPVQSDEVWQTMTQLRKDNPNKKLYAVIEDVGASGAYYIAAGADEIWVNPSSLVGSIGVIIPNYNIEGLLNKLGVKDGTMTAGNYKDILSMSRSMNEFEKQHIQKMLDNTHQHFINAVKTGRGDRLKDPETNHIFSGLFWSGDQAIQLGLADKAGSLSQLEKQLELKQTINYTPEDPMKTLLRQFSTQIGYGMGEKLTHKISGNLVDNHPMQIE